MQPVAMGTLMQSLAAGCKQNKSHHAGHLQDAVPFILQAHGVYEGTYWDLLANIGELTEALTQMAVGPTVLEEPVLQMPPYPTLPSWDTFKPLLQPLPPLPQVCKPRLIVHCTVLCLCCIVLYHATMCFAADCLHDGWSAWFNDSGNCPLTPNCRCLQLMDTAVKLPPFRAPKVVLIEYEAPQLLPLPELLDEEVWPNA